MKLGEWVKFVERFHRIREYSADDQKRIEGYERMLSDMTEAFGDEEELKKHHPKLWNIYDAIQYEKEVLENDLVRN